MIYLRLIFLVIGVSLSIFSNAQYTSIRHEQNEQFKQHGELSEEQWDVIQGTKTSVLSNNKANCNLTHSVYGWNPYWVGTAYNNYDFSLLSTYSHFSYELDPATGNYNDIHQWKTTNAINLAQAAGTRVELCVTNFGSTNNNTFLTNMTARQTFIDSIIVLINYRNADGVNIDFEGIGGANRNDLTSFMTDLSSQLKT
ncbi:MAG: hypothetical protein HRT73_13655, partial [Flavobacteriales bacterium]|nr:hypothetical protein [Flavobacteriales bacterium]